MKHMAHFLGSTDRPKFQLVQMFNDKIDSKHPEVTKISLSHKETGVKESNACVRIFMEAHK